MTLRRVSSVLAAVALVSLPATAQSSNVMRLDTDAGQFATAGGQSDFSSSPKNSQIPPIRWTWRLRAQVTKGSGASALSAMQSIWANADTVNGGSMGMSGLARGTSKELTHTTPSLQKTGKPGAIGFLARMNGQKNLKGVIRVSWQTLFKGQAASTSTIDIGNNKVIEWTGKDTGGGVASVDLPAAFDNNGDLVLRITLGGSMQAVGQFVYSSIYSRLTWKFVQPKTASCKITSYGKGCQGVSATGVVTNFPNHHLISLKVAGGFKNSHVLETVGNNTLNLPLPGGCSLLSNALVILLHKTDANGEYQHDYTVSKFQSSLSFHQYLPIEFVGNKLVIKASNGLQIQCLAAR